MLAEQLLEQAEHLAALDPRKPKTELFARSFEQSEMNSVCKQFASGGLAPRLKALVPNVSSNLKIVAQAFVDLQEARHEADYNLAKRFGRGEVLDLIARAREGFDKWMAMPWTLEVDVFVVALAAGKRIKGD